MPLLIGARVATGDGEITPAPAWVLVDDGYITATGTGAAPATGGDVVDLSGLVLAPAFVDVQVNGVGATDFSTGSVDAIVAAVEELARGGCAACLPTLVSAPLDSYAPALQRIADAGARAPEILGVHLEGPFLGGAPGAHPVDLVRPVELDWLLELCDRHEG